jgi:hypothetical protein
MTDNSSDHRRQLRQRRLCDRIVELRKLGKRYCEIANDLGISEGTVRSSLRHPRNENDEELAQISVGIKNKRKQVRYTDDPRAALPDYGQLPLPPAAEVYRSSTWLIRIEET